MKRLFIPALILLLGLPLFAQTGQAITFFFPPVTGEGAGPDDPAAFTAMTIRELKSRGYILTENELDADFLLSGVLFPYGAVYEDPTGQGEPEEGFYAFRVTLRDGHSSYLLSEQDMLYKDIAEVNDYISLLIFNVLAYVPILPVVTQAPKKPVERVSPAPLWTNDSWRNKWLYAGVLANWAPRFYSNKNSASAAANFGFSFLGEVHFYEHLALETGFEYGEDQAIAPGDIVVKTFSLGFPLLLKGVFKPGLYYMVEPYGGILINAPLSGVIKLPFAALAAGVQMGTRAGLGALILDFRFAMDLGRTELDAEYDVPALDFQRTMLKLGIGYKMGFFDRNKESEQ
ncbi:MAG: hypothetical protein LBD48_05365 [Treponema sp.]|jgi:hypothetical protein|nr:hypothetical protein [Treponema sp.]